MKLSIILTVYNKEPFLRRALDALLNQEDVVDGDYEVLAINDGSTDGSAALLEEYRCRDYRLRVMAQQNQGLSIARNNGLEAAFGEYVWFVDADDMIAPNAVRLICDAMELQPDVIPIYAQTEGIDRVRNAIRHDAHTGKDVISYGGWEQCGVFYIDKKAFLKVNELSFIPGIYHEDAEFTPRMLYKAKSVKVLPNILYTVFRDPDSITQVPRAKRAFDYLIVVDSLSKFVVDNDEVNTLIGQRIDNYSAQDINNALSIISKNDKREQRQFNKVFYNNRHILIRVLKNSIQRKYRVESFLFRLLPKHYVGVYKIMKIMGSYDWIVGRTSVPQAGSNR